MSTRATLSSVIRVSDLAVSATAAAFRIEFLTLSIICGVLAIGAFLSFPLYDDGWLTLVVRESGPHFLTQHMGDRPVFGLLLEQIANFGAANKFVFVLINAIIWLGFAVESGLLFRKLFPELKDYSIVVSCITLAPIVLQTQLSTVLVSIAANLPIVLGYSAILVLIRYSKTERPNRLSLLAIASALAGSAAVFSEYGVATNLVGSSILIGVALTSSASAYEMRRRLLISAAWLFTLTVAAYLLFVNMADFSTRPDVAPMHMVYRGLSKWLEIPFDVIAGTWHAVIGAYAAAIGNVTVAWDSKSTIVAIAFGLLISILLCHGVKNRRDEVPAKDRPKRLFFRIALLFPAIVIGLLPFSVMGRPTTLLEYGSRFRIPITPVAAAITVALALNLVRRKFRWVPVAIFGFIIGFASWTFTYIAIQQSRAIATLESSLKPYVAQADGYTVAVVPFNRFESELTANIASTWSVELEKRFWVVSEDPARIQFGDRSNCRPISAIDVQVRGLTRAGKLGKLLWVEAHPGKPVSVEPYCRPASD